MKLNKEMTEYKQIRVSEDEKEINMLLKKGWDVIICDQFKMQRYKVITETKFPMVQSYDVIVCSFVLGKKTSDDE